MTEILIRTLENVTISRVMVVQRMRYNWSRCIKDYSYNNTAYISALHNSYPCINVLYKGEQIKVLLRLTAIIEVCIKYEFYL